jgi:hypothetical protein
LTVPPLKHAISNDCPDGWGDCVAVVYALTQRSPGGRYMVRYIGSTSATVETRIKWHVRMVGQVSQWNADLAKLLRSGAPNFKVIAEVPDAERYDTEAEVTRRYRRHHHLVNIMDGRKHMQAGRKRISAGVRRSLRDRAA